MLPSYHAREVTFTAGGEQIVGAEMGGGSVGVVLSHEFMSDLCGWAPYADHIARLGYRALALDFGSNLVADVSGAADFLLQAGATKVVLMGASMGATASLVVAAAASPPIAAVASLSGPAMYGGMDAKAASSHLSLPVLYVAAQQDPGFATDAQAMYAACPSAHKQLVVYAGNDHGTQLLRFTVAAQAQARLDAFLAAVPA